MNYRVGMRDIGKITLNEQDTIASVIQNVALILLTRQQSVPLYRGFGLSMNFIDKPEPTAKPLIVSEIHEAIAEYEPRAVVRNITFEADADNPGRLLPTVEVEIYEQ